MDKLLISPSPHIHSGDSIEKNMYGVLIALIPAFICSVVFFGMGAIIVTLTSVIACLFFEYVIQKFILKRQPTIWDGSALITGVLLAFNVPSNLPVWIIIIGALVAIGIGKMSLAACPRIQLLVCGRGNRCNAAFLIKRSCQKRSIRQQCSHG